MKKVSLITILIAICYLGWSYFSQPSQASTYSRIYDILVHGNVRKPIVFVPTVTPTVALINPLAKSYNFEKEYGDVELSFPQLDSDMVYVNSFVELPLFEKDYYWGKYQNAKAGAESINKLPILKTGDNFSLIADKIINIKSYNGFIQPQYGYYFASGVCWSTTTLGYLMDQANHDFYTKYGIDLFIFDSDDRSPHSSFYQTYANANSGYGYAIMQRSEGVAILDYSFTVNPQLANIPEFSDLKIKIVILSTEDHLTADHGQSIAAYLVSNLEF